MIKFLNFEYKIAPSPITTISFIFFPFSPWFTTILKSLSSSFLNSKFGEFALGYPFLEFSFFSAYIIYPKKFSSHISLPDKYSLLSTCTIHTLGGLISFRKPYVHFYANICCTMLQLSHQLSCPACNCNIIPIRVRLQSFFNLTHNCFKFSSI